MDTIDNNFAHPDDEMPCACGHSDPMLCQKLWIEGLPHASPVLAIEAGCQCRCHEDAAFEVAIARSTNG